MLIITFSVAVINAEEKNMLWHLLSCVPSAGVIIDDQPGTSFETLMSCSKNTPFDAVMIRA